MTLIEEPKKVFFFFNFTFSNKIAIVDFLTYALRHLSAFLFKIITIIYFENTHRDKSNNISYFNICIYKLVQNKAKINHINSILSQNYFKTKK
jgi:hypothetical protein